MTIALRPVGDIPKVGFRPISMDVAQDKRTTILVTTTALLDYWLQKIFEGSGPIPKHVRHALGKGIFYTQAIGFLHMGQMVEAGDGTTISTSLM